jgi:Ice-binding-like
VKKALGARTFCGLLLPFLLLAASVVVMAVPTASAATSPSLGNAASYSVLAGSAVTCTGATTTNGDVGVSPGASITGFPSPCTAGPPGTTHSNDASAINAQAANLAAFGTLDQPCDQSFGAVDLTATFPSGVGPGVYCSTSSFTLTGNLNLTGSGVWIFKTVSTIITSPGSSVTGGDPCNVWWRIGSSATLDTTTSFMGNILALTDITMNTGATLNGRALAQGAVMLQANTITGPTCAASGGTTPSPVVVVPANFTG